MPSFFQAPVNVAFTACLASWLEGFGIPPAQTIGGDSKSSMIRLYRILAYCGWHPRFRCMRRLTSLCLGVRQPRSVFTPGLARGAVLFSLSVCLNPALTIGQTAGQAAAATTASDGVGSGAKAAVLPLINTPEDKNKSPHLLAPMVGRPEFVNRQALEQKAGNHPGKMLLRSTPSAAQVWIDGMFVGNTPLLLIVAPGKYEVELRGKRMEHAASAVDLLPNETRVLSLALSARYPTRASVR
jgi:PEGA domain